MRAKGHTRETCGGTRERNKGKKCDTIEQKAAVSSLSEWKKSATRWNEQSIKRRQKGKRIRGAEEARERERQVERKMEGVSEDNVRLSSKISKL